MKLRLLFLVLALVLCFTNGKPLLENTEVEKDTTNTSVEKKDVTETADDSSDESEDEKKDDVEPTPTEETSDDDSTSEDQSSSESENKNEVEEESDDSVESSKKTEVPNKEDTEDIADTEDNEDDESDDKTNDDKATKRNFGGGGGSEGGHHGGDEGGHEGGHGHHEHGHHGHDHNHHDHGYEFYEEWGEHGGHEGEHHGHHEGGHHGEHGHHHGHHGHHERDSVPAEPAAAKPSKEDSSKKWWLVGDHWGGWGHSHWGHPHALHEGGGWQWGHTGLHGHHAGHYKSSIPDCCKSVDPDVTKRCGCDLNTNHHGGYHFTDHGSGHEDHDHHLQGPWTFGYDHFGDDWSDWDHNHHNFEHLSHMHHLPHDDHGCGHGRACVPFNAHRFSQFYPSLHLEAPAGYFGGLGGYGFGGYGAGIAGGYGGGYGGGYALGGPLNNFNTFGYNGWPVRRFNNYRVCHKCHDLPSGGSRCLCKSVRHHPLYLPAVHRPAHVYIDCDQSHHKFPQNTCYARADIPVPEEEQNDGGSAKQGVVYPYVGYGPWSAYPWWGDWWGGHGHHAWGEGHGHGGCGGCGGHGAAHGAAHGATHGAAHGTGHGCGHGCGGHNMGRNIGFSFGGHGDGHGAYHCKDQIEKSATGKQDATSKRFCVPIGYHGGYGFPYFHGYPGVGTGLWGWGWPWIKNKVPGSKLKDKKTESKDAKKSNIPAEEEKKTKKQTIHVGYGFASGDNYRLGYGMGGMGGVAGFTGAAHDAAGEHVGQFARSKIPSPMPENSKDVTGTKRNMGFSQGHPSTGAMLGHPVTHPGYTTMGFPGHGDSSLESQKA